DAECGRSQEKAAWRAYDGRERAGNTRTHATIGGDRRQRAALPTCPLSPRSDEWIVARGVPSAPTRTHTGSRGRCAEVLVTAAVVDPAGDVWRGVLASRGAHRGSRL